MEPIRIELDYPHAIVETFNHIRVDGCRDLEDILSTLMPVGTTLSIHIVMEETGKREQCQFIDPDTESKYRSRCSHVLTLDGICPRQDQHDETTRLYQETHQVQMLLVDLKADTE